MYTTPPPLFTITANMEESDKGGTTTTTTTNHHMLPPDSITSSATTNDIQSQLDNKVPPSPPRLRRQYFGGRHEISPPPNTNTFQDNNLELTVPRVTPRKQFSRVYLCKPSSVIAATKDTGTELTYPDTGRTVDETDHNKSSSVKKDWQWRRPAKIAKRAVYDSSSSDEDHTTPSRNYFCKPSSVVATKDTGTELNSPNTGATIDKTDHNKSYSVEDEDDWPWKIPKTVGQRTVFDSSSSDEEEITEKNLKAKKAQALTPSRLKSLQPCWDSVGFRQMCIDLHPNWKGLYQDESAAIADENLALETAMILSLREQYDIVMNILEVNNDDIDMDKESNSEDAL